MAYSFLKSSCIFFAQAPDCFLFTLDYQYVLHQIIPRESHLFHHIPLVPEEFIDLKHARDVNLPQRPAGQQIFSRKKRT
jgi:hypothetical protein